MKKFLNILGIILIAGVTSYVVVQKTGALTVAQKETAFQRVLRTGTIRCGYYVYPPVTYRDPNSGKLSGFSVDMMEYLAAKAGLKVEWAEEVNFGNWTAALEANRFDAACTPMWPTIALSRVVTFSKPMFFSGIYPLGRADDTRFKTLEDINKPGVRITIHDGNDMLYLAQEVFPKATITALPQNADGQQPILDIMSGKADVMISDKNAVEQWNAKQDKKLAVLGDGKQIKLQSFTLAVKAGESDFASFLNGGIDQMLATGTIDRMLAQWMPYKGVFMPVAAPNADK